MKTGPTEFVENFQAPLAHPLLAVGPRRGRRCDLPPVERQRQPGGGLTAQRLGVVTGRPAAVVDVQDLQLKGNRGRQPGEEVDEGDGIGTAGAGGQHALTRLDEPVRPDELEDIPEPHVPLHPALALAGIGPVAGSGRSGTGSGDR